MPLRLYVGILLLLTSCGAEPSRLQHMADEGFAITQRVTFSATPEAKLQVAQELLTHASLYDQLINRSLLPWTASRGPEASNGRNARRRLRSCARRQLIMSSERTWRMLVMSSTNLFSRRFPKTNIAPSGYSPGPRRSMARQQ